MQYKIIKCTEYRANREVADEWYEVQYLSNQKKWWFFGERVWKTFKEPLWSSGGTFYVNLKFSDEMKAREFINKCQMRIRSNTIVKQETWTLCG